MDRQQHMTRGGTPKGETPCSPHFWSTLSAAGRLRQHMAGVPSPRAKTSRPAPIATRGLPRNERTMSSDYLGHRPALLPSLLRGPSGPEKILRTCAPRTDGPRAPLLGPDAGPWFIRVLLRTPFYVGRRAASGHRPCFFLPSLWTREISAPCLQSACDTRRACMCSWRAVLAARGDSGHGHACGHADSDTVCVRARTRTQSSVHTAVACSELLSDCL